MAVFSRVALVLGTFLLGAHLSTPALAALVTSPGELSATPQVIDFSEFVGPNDFTTDPIQIGNPVGLDIEWRSTESGSNIGNGFYGLLNNGLWTTGRQGYTGLNTQFGSMTFTFNDGPVSGVGGFINYSPNAGTVLIEALDADMNVLESYDITLLAPIVTPMATDAGAFRGIQRATADIYAFRLSNQYVVLDDLTFVTANDVGQPEVRAVPSLSTTGMLLLIMMLLASGPAALRRKRMG